ncbi:cyclase family protein [Aestuariimicrobium sp. Y1814]|uniref:cyclase family protein n=1 Tax=Aestuariimicrobium sp. Y1814 TaxID=3418742 RepID=UPI003DA6DEFD
MSDITTAARDAAFAAFTGGFRLVDLTDVLGPDTVLWPGAPALEATDIITHGPGAYHARVFTTFEHAGTHFDAPEHFVPGGVDAAGVPLDDLVVPVVVIDITEQAAATPNYTLQVADVEAFEAANGTIAAGSAVVLNTGWAHKKDSVENYAGSADPDQLKFPAFGVEAAQVLVERGVVGLGVDTLGIDPGNEPTHPVHRNVTHINGLWHLENLINVDQLPPTGAVIVVGVPRIAGGTGFPSRVFAFVPKN